MIWVCPRMLDLPQHMEMLNGDNQDTPVLLGSTLFHTIPKHIMQQTKTLSSVNASWPWEIMFSGGLFSKNITNHRYSVVI